MSRSSLLYRVYLALAVAGLFLSWWYFIQYFLNAESYKPGLFFSSVMVNAASSGVAMDAMLAGVVFSVMVLARSRRDGVRWPWLYVAMTFLIGLCVAMPLYLAFCERARARGSETGHRS